MAHARRRLLPSALVVAALTLSAACGGGGDDEPRPAQPSSSDDGGAAEPADAPEPTQEPAGDVTRIGAKPQGVVYDATTRTLAVAVREPYRLLLVDPTTSKVREAVRMPGKIRHLQVARPGGPVLVPAESANQVVEVTLPDGRTRATDVQRQPHDAAGARNGDLVVGNEFSGSISFVRDGRVVRTVSDLEQPGGVVVDGDVVGVVDVKGFTLSTYDLASMRRTGRIGVGEGPTHGVVVGAGKVAVTDTRGDQLLLSTLRPLRRTAALPLPGGPYGITADTRTGLVWVTLTARNEVVGVSTAGTPRVVARYPTVRQPDTVAVEPGSKTLWVTGTADGELQRIER